MGFPSPYVNFVPAFFATLLTILYTVSLASVLQAITRPTVRRLVDLPRMLLFYEHLNGNMPLMTLLV